MPPSAAPVWLRTGWSFETIATSAPSSCAAIAARRPAPPAPTTITSCSCTVIISPELEIRLDCLPLELLDVLGQRDVLRADLGAGELGLAAPDAVFLLHDAEPVFLQLLLVLPLVHVE